MKSFQIIAIVAASLFASSLILTPASFTKKEADSISEYPDSIMVLYRL